MRNLALQVQIACKSLEKWNEMVSTSSARTAVRGSRQLLLEHLWSEMGPFNGL